MPIEYIEALEQKIDAIIKVVQRLKTENSQLLEQAQEQTSKFESLENENKNLADQIRAMQGSSDERQQKIDTAATRIQELLAKLESIEK